MLPLLAASVVVSVGALKSSATTATTVSTSPATSKTLSVLHMVADDLRPELGLYNSPNTITPNLDAIASKGTVFTNAYCQQPVCSPSRNSFMTSLRPDSTGAWNFINYFRQKHPDAVSFPEFFKKQPGYLALGSGKLYHSDNPPQHDEPTSWSPEPDGSQDYFEPAWLHCNAPASTFCVNDTKPELEDEATAKACIAHLAYAKAQGKKSYVGCGTMAEGVPKLAEIVNFRIGVENGTQYPWSPTSPVPVEVQVQVRRHYFAAITFMDAQVGKVVASLNDLGLASSTIIIFHADHGYFQGESGEWEKKMLFENTARVPLIIYDPTNPVHRRSTEIVELVDVYPTAAVLAGFPEPEHLDGISIAPLMGNKLMGQATPTMTPEADTTRMDG
eukprot:gene2184-5399_t